MLNLATRYPKSLWSYNPIPFGCVYYAPLWNPACHGPVFKSIDPFGHTCTRTGGVMDGSGFTTSGGDDDISIPDHITLDITAAISIEFWMKSSDTANTSRPVAKSNTSYNLQILGSNDAGSGGIRWVVDIGGVVIGTESSVVATGNWVHVIGVNDGTDLFIYLDGVEDTKDAGSGGTMDTDNNNLFIASNEGVGDFYTGIIGEVYIYNRALSAAEVLHKYEVTKGRIT